MSNRELHEIAATAVGRRPPRIGIPMSVLRTGARANDVMARLLANTLLGLPPVVVGLLVYLLLSRSGPLGSLGLLFTPTAMTIAQSTVTMV